jgi:cytochrome c-type biogenesis protein CcmH/NrfG
MIWLWLGAAALVTLGLLLWLGRIPAASRALVAAALMLGLAGYALKGAPGQPGKIVSAAPADAGFGEAIGGNQSEMRERFGEAGQWLGMADAMLRRGRTDLAIKALEGGLKQYPDNIDLWVAFANALVAHGGNKMTPAAALAFDEATKRAPDHPAPAFFAGLAMARGGDLAGAEFVWADLLRRSPADAPWRSDLEARLAQLRAMRPQAPPAAPKSTE